MNYAAIKKYDVANGTGIRVSLFVSGCTHHCPNCFNEEAWDFSYGKPFTNETVYEIVDALNHEYITGLSLLGGEPMEHVNQKGLLPLVQMVKERYPHKTIWMYTGYDFEKDVLGRMVAEWPETRELLRYIDILVDGEFIEAQKDLQLRFKGSDNQRIINVKESLAANKLVLWIPTEYGA